MSLGNELLNITDLYYTSGQLDSAEISVRKALTIARELNEKTYQVYGYMHLGNIYKKRKQFPEAENYLQLSISARDLHDDIGSTLTSINILSRVALEQVNENGVVAPSFLKIKDRSAAIMESMSDIVWAINPLNDTMVKLISRMKKFAAEILEPGTGFDAGEISSGNGLANMYARASSMSATFNIDTAPEKGSSIQLITPLT